MVQQLGRLVLYVTWLANGFSRKRLTLRTVTLIPYITFSLFHVLIYFRVSFLPAVSPAASPFAVTRRLSPYIEKFVSIYQPNALFFAAYIEVILILPLAIFGLFVGWTSIFTVFMYLNFVRYKYELSFRTRKAFQNMRNFLDKSIVDSPRIPQPLQTAYSKIRDAFCKAGEIAQNQNRRGNSTHRNE